jgi:hypothetical protein
VRLAASESAIIGNATPIGAKEVVDEETLYKRRKQRRRWSGMGKDRLLPHGRSRTISTLAVSGGQQYG